MISKLNSENRTKGIHYVTLFVLLNLNGHLVASMSVLTEDELVELVEGEWHAII